MRLYGKKETILIAYKCKNTLTNVTGVHMNLERRPFWLIGGIALSLALAFSACDSTSNSTTVDDDEEALDDDSDSGKSGDSKSGKDGKDSVTVPTEMDTKIPVPTDLKAVRLSPSMWELSFKVSDETDGFVVQRLPQSGGSWSSYAELKSGVTRLVLDGSSKGGYYYRVASVMNKKSSAYSDEVLVSDRMEYPSGSELKVPEATPNILQDKVLELVLSGGAPGKDVVKSPYNLDSSGKAVGSVYYQARFVYGSDLTVDTVKFDVDQVSVSKTFKTTADLCNSYAQIRTVWTDKNKVSDYSDWSSPMGTKAGTDSKLVNTNNRCKADTAQSTVVTEEGGLPGPTNPKVEQLSDGKWMMQWDYTPSEDRPETGFIVQKLDTEKSKWTEVDSTGNGVYRCVLGKLTDTYNYFRVVAYDKDGRSAYSADVLAANGGTATGDGGQLQTPNGLTFVRIAPSVWEMSWKYDIAAEKPENQFIIQSSKLKDFEWKTIATIKGENRVFLVDGLDKLETYYRIATTDGVDTSLFSEAVQLTNAFPFRADLNPVTPELSISLGLGVYTGYEVNMDTSSKDEIYVGASVAYDIKKSMVDKNIYESDYTDTVYYEARWFTPTQYDPRGDQVDLFNEGKLEDRENLGVSWDEAYHYSEPAIAVAASWGDSIILKNGDVVTILEQCEEAYGYNDIINGFEADTLKDDDGKVVMQGGKPVVEYTDVSASIEDIIDGAVTIDKASFLRAERISKNTALCIQSYARRLCDYRIQVRVVWKDTNGETAYSEWTLPTGIESGRDADKFCYD